MITARCPYCLATAAVPDSARDRDADCGRCGRGYVVRAEDAAVPVVYPPGTGPTPGLVGLALLPFGIPLLWLLGPLAGGREPVFTVAVAVAVAVAAAGLGLGVAITKDWSGGARVRGILAVVAVGYGSAAFLYFLQKEWLEEARKRVEPGRGDRFWQEHTAAGAYTIKFPGRPKPADESPVPGWDLKAVRFANPPRTTDVFTAAHGVPPAGVAKLDDDAWFAAAKKAVEDAAGVAPLAETPVTRQTYPGREFAFALPDNITNRTVRIFRVGRRAIYLAADGAALPADAGDVKTFFDSLYVKPPRE